MFSSRANGYPADNRGAQSYKLYLNDDKLRHARRSFKPYLNQDVIPYMRACLRIDPNERASERGYE